MARTARFVVPDCPHHVTQRGNRRQRIFFQPADYRVYRHMLGEHLRRWNVACWAYCLMPNHVHLVVTPSCEDGLSRAIGQAHRQYASYINARLEAVGHLFQGRFGSVAMDEAHFFAAVRYVSLNPVRAGLVAEAQQWPWSSVGAHLSGRDDGLVTAAPLLDRVGAFGAWLIDQPSGWSEAAERTGKPVGDKAFLERIGRRQARSGSGTGSPGWADASSGEGGMRITSPLECARRPCCNAQRFCLPRSRIRHTILPRWRLADA